MIPKHLYPDHLLEVILSIFKRFFTTRISNINRYCICQCGQSTPHVQLPEKGNSKATFVPEVLLMKLCRHVSQVLEIFYILPRRIGVEAWVDFLLLRNILYLFLSSTSLVAHNLLTAKSNGPGSRSVSPIPIVRTF